MHRTVSFERFQSTPYFPELDGLRTVSILLVIALHSTDPLWRLLHGNVGVTVFFVISGFLITTLLLREETDRGSADVRAFYIRRAFRILPAYYLTLFAYVLLIGILKMKSGADNLWRALPYYLTYQNDFAPIGLGFGHTWSLAVEEKFYLLWPLIFCVMALRARRLPITVLLIAATGVASLSDRGQYVAIYAPILCGCLLAQLMHQKPTYDALRRLAATPVLIVILALAGVQVAWFENDGRVHVVFGALVTLAMPGVLVGPTWVTPMLTNRVARYIGTRSYAVYLVHRIAKVFVDRVIAPEGTSSAQIARLVLIVLIALLMAEAIYHLVEHPMIQAGRRLARSRSLQAVSGGHA